MKSAKTILRKCFLGVIDFNESAALDAMQKYHKSEVKKLNKKNGMFWRDLRKEMPPEHEDVLVRLDNNTYLMGVMESNDKWGIYWADGRNAEDPDRPVTHWMPVPAF